MIENAQKLYHVEFNASINDVCKSLIFYEIPPSIRIKPVPEILSQIKSIHEKSQTHITLNNITKISKIDKNEVQCPPNRFFCLLWTTKTGTKNGILFERSDGTGNQVVGIWNLQTQPDLKILEATIEKDLQNIADPSKFNDVSLFY